MVRHQNKNYKKEKINNSQIEGMSTIESIITIGLGILLLFIGGGSIQLSIGRVYTY